MAGETYMGNIINFYGRQKKVMDMCKILRKIHNKTADQLLKEYGVYNTLPIDLEKLAIGIGISVLPADFSEIEKKLDKKDILGMVRTDGDNAAIFYKQDTTENRLRFTVAHELAHCCHIDPDNCKTPHIEYRIDENKKDETEKQMDIFAGELLMPLHKIKEVYMSLPVPSAVTMAKLFKVSVSVMEARLNYLKISHFNRKGEPVAYE